MDDAHRRLYAELAKALGLKSVEGDAAGNVQITVGDDVTVVLFVENPLTLTIVAPVIRLPSELDHAIVLWLLRRNHYDSAIAPFRISCNSDNNLTIWGRVPVENLSGADLAALIDDVAAEVGNVREELGVAPTSPDAADGELEAEDEVGG
jgi:Tir chaperone protein (CesT) family